MYLHKENRLASSKTIIIGSITALYALTTINFAISWWGTNERFGAPGGSVQILAGPTTVAIVITILQFFTQNSVTFVIADAVLVWRCFHACGQSLRSSVMPIALFILETVLVICNITVSCLRAYFFFSNKFENPSWNSVSFILEGAMYVSVAATSLMATFIICWQVYAYTKHASGSRKRYRNIIDVLIQSSALYSSMLVVEAVVNIIEGLPSSLKPTTPQNMYPGLIQVYLDLVVPLLTGTAPTLMVARMAMLSPHEDTEVSSFSFPTDFVARPTFHSNGPQINNNDVGC
ncbi:hypothetical protein D9613_007360 [Agrocybe pediades]|uniref:Uncharacterized protein n=1 Tax=Agrocybe pediades TaxID=84607 RepID=A0A8H4VLD9_9AGAR|nr:hypothetical protein D9613_007360 [Agrocybe pediades]